MGSPLRETEGFRDGKDGGFCDCGAGGTVGG